MAIPANEYNQAEAGAKQSLTKPSLRLVAFDYLRACTIVLVMWDHAIMAYTQFAFINFENPIANSNPVVNVQRWLGFDLFVAFNETFFMPLLFCVSGMFVWQGLVKKGGRKYLAGRLTRLGLPFVIGVLFLMPLAYYPAQLQWGLITGVKISYGAFWLAMVRSCFGTAGPLWFLWLLLTFNCLATLLYQIFFTPGGFMQKRQTVFLERPAAFLGLLLGISIVVYLPMAIIFGPQQWIGIGPFNVQASRILLYLTYFFAGTMVGAWGFETSVFRPGGSLAKRWWGWLVVGLLAFTVFIIMLVSSDTERSVAGDTAFVVCCWATVFGMIGFFLRFAKQRIGIFDSLSKNGYGIYVVHYVFVTWLQYLLLKSSLHPIVKGLVVFLGTLLLSWGTVAAIRRIPAVAKVI